MGQRHIARNVGAIVASVALAISAPLTARANPPSASNLTANGGTAVTDTQISNGNFSVVLYLNDGMGVETVSAPIPEFDIVTPSGIIILTNESFESFNYLNATSVVATDNAHVGMRGTAIELGTYTSRWSATSSNAANTLDSTTYADGSPVTFQVIDDDSTAPVAGSLSPNLFINGSFEANAANWNHFGLFATASLSAAESGAYGLLVTNFGGGVNGTNSGYEQWVDVVADTNYRVTVRARAVTSSALPTNAMLGYWRMEESAWDGTAGEIIDSSGNGIHALAYPGGAAAPDPVAGGYIGKGGQFAPNDYAYVSDYTALDPGSNVTLACWIRNDDPAPDSWDVIAGEAGFWNAHDFALVLNYGAPNFYINAGEQALSPTVLTVGQWYHLAGVYDGTNIILYVDGVEVARTASAVLNDDLGDNGNRFGWGTSDGVSYGFQGMIDELRLYDDALTSNQIFQLYQYAEVGFAGVQVDHYGAAGFISSVKTNLVDDLSVNWQDHSLAYATPANTTSNRISFYATNSHYGSYGYTHFDNASVRVDTGSYLSVFIGSTAYAGSDNSDNATYTMTDGDLTAVSAVNPLRLSFMANDPASGLSRGVADTNTQMHISIGSVITNNLTNYVAAESSSYIDSHLPTSSNVWKFVGVDIAALVGTNMIAATLCDADADRPNDQAVLHHKRFGMLAVVDDDTEPPVPGVLSANDLVNESFETNAADWVNFGIHSTSSVVAVESGSYGIAITNFAVSADGTNSGYAQWIVPSASESYRMTVRAKSTIDPGPAPTAYWAMNEGSGSNVYDSVGPYDGTNAGVTEWVSGYSGAGLAVTNYYIDTMIPVSTNFTLSIWFKYPLAANATDYQGIYDFRSTYHGAHQDIYWVHKTSQQLGSWRNGLLTYSLSVLSPGWHHMAIVAGEGGDQRNKDFYIDGVFVGRLAAYNATYTYLNVIGRQYNSAGRRWGVIDDFKFFDYSLASNDVYTIAQAPPPPEFIGMEVEQYGASGFISTFKTNISFDIAPNWDTYELNYDTPATVTSNRVALYATNANASGGAYYFDNAYVSIGGAAISFEIGGTSFAGSDKSLDAIYSVTDADLSVVSGATPLRIALSAYDVPNGVSRGTTDTNIHTHISIQGLTTNNVGNYLPAESSAFIDTFQPHNSNIWSFSSVNIISMLGTNEIVAALCDKDEDWPGDQAIENHQRYGYLAVLDDDPTPPTNFNFNVGEFVRYDTNLVLGGFYITGQVQDVESGVFGAPNHTYSLVRDGATVAGGVFTNAPASNGDAKATPGSLGVTIPGAIIEIPGNYTLYVTNRSFDTEYAGDDQEPGASFTFAIVPSLGPWSIDFGANSGNDVTDQQITNGLFGIFMQLEHESGVETVSATSPYFPPHYDILNAAGTPVLVDDPFAAAFYTSTSRVTVSDGSHPGAASADVDLGTYKVQFSAVSSNGLATDNVNLYSNTIPMTFEVRDDDTNAPEVTVINVNRGNQMHDRELAQGIWLLALDISDTNGVVTYTSTTWSPHYRIITPASYAPIEYELWEIMQTADEKNYVFADYVPQIASTSIVLGTHHVEWTIQDDDKDRPGDRMAVTNGTFIAGTSNTFYVIDDDTNRPTPPRNLDVWPTTWTNDNTFQATWINALDPSGIYQYRGAVNDPKPSALTDGFVIPVAMMTPYFDLNLTNADFEYGADGGEMPYTPALSNSWSSFSKFGVGVPTWSSEEAQSGSQSLKLYCPNSGAETGQNWAAAATMVSIENTNKLPVDVTLSGWFKGNMNHQTAGNKATPFLKIEGFSGYSDSSTNRVDFRDNEWPPEPNALAGTDVSSWTYMSLTATNLSAETESIRFMVGIAQHYNGVDLTGYWDNISATVRVATNTTAGMTITNVAEGVQTNWFFTVDHDIDRTDDQLMSAVTNLITKYDATAPALVNMTNIALGPITNTQVELGWDPLPDAGNPELSPWWTYVIYYTDQSRDATNTDPFVASYTGGPKDLGTNTTTRAIVSNLLPGVTYRFSVVGRDAAGNEGPLPGSSQVITLGKGPPVAISMIVNGGEDVTDEQIASGLYDLSMELFHEQGIESVNTLGGYFVPEYDIWDSASRVILTNELFSSFAYSGGGNQLSALDSSRWGVAKEVLRLGQYTLYWSAISSNLISTVDSNRLLDATYTRFNVVDDDTESPAISPIAGNKLLNPGFETNGAGWTPPAAFGGLGAEASQKGTYGLFFTNVVGSDYQEAFQWRDASPDKAHEFSVWARSRGLTLPKPKLHFKFEEGSGSEVYDETGMHRGTNFFGRWEPSFYGTALSTSNNGTWLQAYPSVVMGTNWAISCWFRYPLAEAPVWNTLVRNGSHYDVIVNATNQEIGTYASGFYGSGFHLSDLYPGWHHLTVVGGHGGNNTKFYINGAFAGESAYRPTASITYLGNSGGGSGSYPFGTYDEFMVFGDVLSSNQVSELYNAETFRRVGMKVDFYGAAGFLGSKKLDLGSRLTNAWTEHKLAFTTPPNTTSNKYTFYATNSVFSQGRYDFDNAYATDESGVPLAIYLGSQLLPRSDDTTQAMHRITDAALATVGPANPLRFTLGTYDLLSGLSLGTGNTNTNTVVHIGTWVSNNAANYVSSESSPYVDTFLRGATNTWRFDGPLVLSDIDALFGSNLVAATLRDNDKDRTLLPDQGVHYRVEKFGFLDVVDDDADPPVPGALSTNMLVNPGFETNGAGWNGFGSFAGVSPDSAQTGGYGLMISNGAPPELNGHYQWVAASPNKSHRLSVNAKLAYDPWWPDQLSHWDFEEGIGTNTVDVSTNGYNLQLNGGPNWLPGRDSEHSIQLNDSVDSLLFESGSPSLPTRWGISMWFKYPLEQTVGTWNSMGRIGGSHPIIVRKSDQLLGVYYSGGHGFKPCYYYLSGLEPGWHHMTVAGTHGGIGYTYFYIDGVYVGASAFRLTGSLSQLGNGSSGQQWGTLDDITFFNEFLYEGHAERLYQSRIGMRVEHYGAAGYLSTSRTNVLMDITDDWDQFNLYFETPANTTSNKVIFEGVNSDNPNNRVSFDNAFLTDEGGAPLRIDIGGTVYTGSNNSVDATYTINDAQLASAGPANRLRLAFAAYDIGNGVARGTSDTNTESHISVENWITNNVTNYVSTQSSPFLDTYQPNNSSIWEFAAAIDVNGLMGTNEIYAGLYDTDNDRTGDAAFEPRQRFGYLAIIDDDPTAPSNFNFNVGNGRTYASNQVVGGFTITGFVQDAESGVLAAPNHTYSLERGGTTVAGGAFSTAPAVNGSAMATPGSLAITIPGAIIEILGDYTLYVTNMNYDQDRVGDTEIASDVFTFRIVSNLGPYALSYVVNGGTNVTDGQVNGGDFEVTMNLAHGLGVETVNATAPYFVPTFDVITPSSVEILANEPFNSFTYLDAKTVAATDTLHVGAFFASVELGTHQLRWSAVSSNALTTIDYELLSNGVPMTFDVIDDDTVGPVATAFEISTNVLTDHELSLGGWGIGLAMFDESGIVTNVAQGVMPSYDLINAAGLPALDNQLWLDLETTNGGTLVGAADNVPALAYDRIDVGTYTFQWSAYDNDSDRPNDQAAVIDSTVVPGGSNTFLVLDDDPDAPGSPVVISNSASGWTNVNYFKIGYEIPADFSGIYQYRISTNDAMPTNVTDGTVIPLEFAWDEIPVDYTNGVVEYSGAHGVQIPSYFQPYGQWMRWGGSMYWWTNDSPSAGSTKMLKVRNAGGWNLSVIDVNVAPWNPGKNRPFTIDFGADFKGDVRGGSAWPKIEYPSAAAWHSWDSSAAPFYNANYPNWTNFHVTISNYAPAMTVLRLDLGTRNWSGSIMTCFWDNAWVTVKIASTTSGQLTFTNAPEGTRTNWLFTVDDDNDRINDRMMSDVTNFITQIDQTPPALITVTNAVPGPDPTTQITFGWEPAPDGGGTNLSPWDTYIIYYTSENRPANEGDPFIDKFVGPANLGTNITRTATLSGLTTGQAYYVAIAGRDTAGNNGILSPSWRVQLTTVSSVSASNLLVNGGLPLTDADVRAGNFGVRMYLTHEAGVETVNAVAPSFIPEFDIMTPASVAVLTDETFEDFTYVNEFTVIATDATHAGAAYADTLLGSYTIRWSAASSNGPSTVDSTLLSDGSSASFTVIDDDSVAPTPPTAIDVAPSGWTRTNFVQLSWTDGSDGSGIAQYRVDTNYAMPSSIADGVMIPVSKQFTDASEGIHTNWVFAVDNDNDRPDDSRMSAITNFITMLDTTTPAVVGGLTAAPGADENSEIFITWTPLLDAGGVDLSPWHTYRIYYTDQPRNPTNGDPFAGVGNGYASLGDITTGSAMVSNLIPDISYNISVVGRDAAGNESPFGPAVSFTVSPLTLTQGIVAAVGGTKLAWRASTNSSGDVNKPYDLIYVDNLGFSDSLTSRWDIVGTVTNSTMVDTGYLARPSPLSIGETMRFYRAASAGMWAYSNATSYASREVYVSKNIRLENGHNFISLFMEPDTNTLRAVMGVSLPANNGSAFATQIEWYDASTNGNPTNVVYLNHTPRQWRWLVPGSGIADNKPMPIGQGFNVKIPTGGPISILVIGKVPSNEFEYVVSAAPDETHINIANNCVPRWTRLDELNLEGSGLVAGTTRRKSDEIRVLEKGVGPFGSPRLRAWLSSADGNWRRYGDGAIINHEVIAPDETIIILTKKSTDPFVWTNKLHYTPPGKNMNP